jgi:hypothetical protein
MEKEPELPKSLKSLESIFLPKIQPLLAVGWTIDSVSQLTLSHKGEVFFYQVVLTKGKQRKTKFIQVSEFLDVELFEGQLTENEIRVRKETDLRTRMNQLVHLR